MLEFVDVDLYFVQDKNNFINPLLQVGSGSGSVEKSTGSGGPKITGSGSSSLLFLCFCTTSWKIAKIITNMVKADVFVIET